MERRPLQAAEIHMAAAAVASASPQAYLLLLVIDKGALRLLLLLLLAALAACRLVLQVDRPLDAILGHKDNQAVGANL